MAEELDEFGIPIKQAASAGVDEFGIPLKKKEPTSVSPATSTSGLQTVAKPSSENGGKDDFLKEANALSNRDIQEENFQQGINPELSKFVESKRTERKLSDKVIEKKTVETEAAKNLRAIEENSKYPLLAELQTLYSDPEANAVRIEEIRNSPVSDDWRKGGSIQVSETQSIPVPNIKKSAYKTYGEMWDATVKASENLTSLQTKAKGLNDEITPAIEDLRKKAEYIPDGTDANGNEYLKLNPMQAFANGFGGSLDMIELGVKKMNPFVTREQLKEDLKIKYLRDNVLFPKQAEGKISRGAEMIGGVAPLIAATAIAPSGIGALAANALTFGTMDMGGGLYEGFAEGKANGLNDDEALEYADKLALEKGATGAILGATMPAQGALGRKMFLNKAEANAFKTFLSEQGVMVPAFMSKTVLDNAFAKTQGSERDITEGAVQAGIDAFIIGGMTHAIANLPKMPKATKDIFENTIAKNYESLGAVINKAVSDGALDYSTGQRIAEKAKAFESVPKDLEPKLEERILPKQIEIDNLTKENEGKKGAFADANDGRIEELNKEIKEDLGTPLNEKEQKDYETIVAKEEQKPAEGKPKPKLTDLEKSKKKHYEKRIKKAEKNAEENEKEPTEVERVDTETSASEEVQPREEGKQTEEVAEKPIEEGVVENKLDLQNGEETEISERGTSTELGKGDSPYRQKQELQNRLGEGVRAAEEKLQRQLDPEEKREEESAIAYNYAKENGLWVPDLLTLGDATGIGGNENTLVLNKGEGIVYKSNNLFNSGNSIKQLFDNVDAHNELFPESKYEFVGFTGIENSNGKHYIEPIFKQDYIDNAEKATQKEIDAYMKSLGLKKINDHTFEDSEYKVSDIRPRNVLKDEDGNFLVIDDIVTRKEAKKKSKLEAAVDKINNAKEAERSNPIGKTVTFEQAGSEKTGIVKSIDPKTGEYKVLGTGGNKGINYTVKPENATITTSQTPLSEKSGKEIIQEGWDDIKDALKPKGVLALDPKLVTGFAKIGYGLIKEGHATAKNVMQKIKDYLKEKGVVVSDKDFKESEKEIKEKIAELNQKSFLETVKDSPSTSEEMAKKTAELDQFYETLHNKDALAAADKKIKEDLTAAKDFVLGDSPPSAEKSAMAVRLIKHYESQKDFDNAIEILNAYDNQLRESGRFIQAASLWNKLDPNTIVRVANKEAKKLGQELSPEMQKDILRRMTEVQKLPEGTERDKGTLEVLDFIASQLPPTKGDLFDAYRYQNMLSNPLSHLRNIYGNMFNVFVTEPASLGIRSGYDILNNLYNPMASEAKFSQIPKYYVDAITNIPEAFSAAIQAFKQGYVSEKILDMGDTQSQIEALRRTKLPKIATISARLLEAEDRFFSVLISQGEKFRLMRNGIEETEANNRAMKLANEYLYRDKLNASDKTKASAVRALDAIGQGMNHLRKLPAGVGKGFGWFVPFVTTPINVTKLGVKFSPLGLIGGKEFYQSPEAKTNIANATLGSIVLGAGATLAMQGLTTWSVPKDKKERELFYAAGMKPYSVKIGDKWIPMTYFGPFALGLAIPAGAKHYWSDSKTALTDNWAEKAGEMAMGSAGYIGSQTPLTGASGFFKAMAGEEDFTSGKQLGYTSTQLIPASGLIRYVNQWLDPVYRKSKTFQEAIKSGIPELSKELEPYMTIEGDTATRDEINNLVPYPIGISEQEYEEQLKDRKEELKEEEAEKDKGAAKKKAFKFKQFKGYSKSK